MADSRLETAYDQIVTALQGMTVANGYENTVANVCKVIRPFSVITSWPEIGVELGDGVIEARDDNWDLFSEKCDVHIVAQFKATTDSVTDPENIDNLYTEAEEMIQDLSRLITSDLIVENLVDASNRWNVERGELEFQRVLGLGRMRNVGIVSTTIRVHMRNLDASFDD